jgi:hypothetical protein
VVDGFPAMYPTGKTLVAASRLSREPLNIYIVVKNMHGDYGFVQDTLRDNIRSCHVRPSTSRSTWALWALKLPIHFAESHEEVVLERPFNCELLGNSGCRGRE